MLFSNKYRALLSEAATADMLDAEVSTTVKDTVEELQDTLTNNIELVPEKDMSTNRAELQLTPEMCIVREASEPFSNGAKYMIEMNDLLRLCEEEETAAVDAGADPATVSADAGDMADAVASANGVPEDADVVVVVNHSEAAFLAEAALLESKAGRTGVATMKLEALVHGIKDCQAKGIQVVKAGR